MSITTRYNYNQIKVEDAVDCLESSRDHAEKETPLMTPKSINQTKLVSPTKIDINDSVDFKLPNLDRKYIKTMK